MYTTKDSGYLYGCEKHEESKNRSKLARTTSMVTLLTSNIPAMGCWGAIEPLFIANALVATLKMRRQGHVAHGTSRLYPSVRSLRDLHSLGPNTYTHTHTHTHSHTHSLSQWIINGSKMWITNGGVANWYGVDCSVTFVL